MTVKNPGISVRDPVGILPDRYPVMNQMRRDGCGMDQTGNRGIRTVLRLAVLPPGSHEMRIFRCRNGRDSVVKIDRPPCIEASGYRRKAGRYRLVTNHFRTKVIPDMTVSDQEIHLHPAIICRPETSKIRGEEALYE